MAGSETENDSEPCKPPDKERKLGLMSATAMLQLKQNLSRLSERERQEVSAFLHRLKQESPAWQKEMTRRMSEMDAGKKIRLPKTLARA